MSDDSEPEQETALGEDDVRKPGQKFVTPSPGYADRVFYESLLQQRPDSIMAQEWCVLYGILSYERADELHRMICKRKGKAVASPTKASKPKEAAPKAKKARVIDESAIVADTGLDLGNGDETRGASSY